MGRRRANGGEDSLFLLFSVRWPVFIDWLLALGAARSVGSFLGFAFTDIVNIVLTNMIFAVLKVVALINVITSSSARAIIGSGSVFMLSFGNDLSRHMRRGPLRRLLKRRFRTCNLSSVLTSVGGTGSGSGVGNVCVRPSCLRTSCTSLRRVHGTLLSFGRDNGFVITCTSRCTRKVCCLSDITSGVVVGPRKDVK